MKIQDKEVPTLIQRKICWAALTGVALVVVVSLVFGLLFGLGSLFVALEPVLLPVVIAGFLAYLLSPCVALVEDSLFDARCAENAGTSLVLVGWGYAADPAALRARPAPVCETVAELELNLLGI